MDNKISFWNFISNTNIEIPIIQRDYAQGRLGKEYLRQNFLIDLKKALDKNLPNGEQYLKLDFVYGAVDKAKMQPLDGQQRLTTLWLLHWYVALRANKLEEACQILKNFTYETRISSREFFHKLCIPTNFETFKTAADTGIAEFITSRTWFPAAWKQDPTIQALLRMLSGTKLNDKYGEDITDGIEELFQDTTPEKFEEYWKILTSEDAPIVFYQLSLDHFGLSDDLYIKMNARGKQLTMFENFKADLVGYIRKQAQDNEEWKSLLDIKTGIPISLDTTWMELFWKNRSGNNRVDEIYFEFLNRFFLNYHIEDIKDEDDKYYSYLTGRKTKEHNRTVRYKSLDNYKWNNEIDKVLFDDLKVILDNLSISNVEQAALSRPWSSEFQFIPQYKIDNVGKNVCADTETQWLVVDSITQQQRVVFYAICKFFKEGAANTDLEKKDLKNWMRFVWNMASVRNPDGGLAIDSVSSMKSVISVLSGFDAHNIYKELKYYDKTAPNNAFGRQLIEEIEKAKIILADDYSLALYKGSCRKQDGSNYTTWEEIIEEAEQFAFFDGGIRFLIRNNADEWTVGFFDEKWINAQNFFDKNGVKDTEEYKYKSKALVLKAVLYQAKDYQSLIEGDKFVLDNTAETWRNRILLRSQWATAVHQILMNNLNITVREGDFEIYKDLYSTNLLNFVANQERRYRIKNIHYKWAIYPPRLEGFIPDQNDFHRNKLLNECETAGKINIYTEQKIPNCNMLKGWGIYFNYLFGDKTYYFIYWHDNKVYAMEEKWSSFKTRNASTPNASKEYYCKDVGINPCVTDFCNLLEDIIKMQE
jgi:putative uncharacterized protein (fragment)